MLEQVGKLVAILGVSLAFLGGLLYLLGRLGVSGLPGDVSWGGRNWRIYVPIGTCIVLSILLTLILWIVQRLRR